MDLNKFAADKYRKSAGLLKSSDKDKKPANPVADQAAPAKPAKPTASTSAPADKAAARKASPLGGLIAGGRTEDSPDKTDIAKYLLIIGPEQASMILKHLPESAVESIVQEISTIGRVEPEEKKRLLEKFSNLFAQPAPPAKGGVETARGFLAQAFGDEKAEQFIRRAVPGKVKKHFDFLEAYEPRQINSILRAESPAFKALILSHLSPPKAAAILALHPAAEQVELVKRLGSMGKLDRDVLIRVEEAVQDKIRKFASKRDDETYEIDGRSVLAEILKNMDARGEAVLLEYLEAEEPDLSSDIKERLFTIDTLLAIDDRDLQKVLQDVDNNRLALILKGKTEEIRSKLLRNVSASRAQLIIDEYQLLGPKLRSEIDEATREFVGYLRSLEEAGKLVVHRQNEQYI